MDTEILNFIRKGIVFYFILLGSVSVHEWAHAFVADKLGDPLPRSQGRVTLNPLAHIDILGTVIFPLVMIFWPLFAGMSSKVALFGWGKPVQILLPNPKTRKRDDILIAIAGPISNLLICLVVAVIGGLIGSTSRDFLELFTMIILTNSGLAAFNLIPLPPLDGSHILKRIINMSEETYYRIAQWSFLILLVLINLPATRGILRIMILGTAEIFYSIMMLVGSR